MFKEVKNYINHSLEWRIPIAISITLMVVLGTPSFLLIQHEHGQNLKVKTNDVQQISTAANEQSTRAETSSRDIEGVSTVSKEAANSAREMATGVTELNGYIQDLNVLVGRFQV